MEAGRNYCRMAMRTGLGPLRGFSCEVLEGLTGNSESAAFSTSTCWPPGCGNRLQGTKRLSLSFCLLEERGSASSLDRVCTHRYRLKLFSCGWRRWEAQRSPRRALFTAAPLYFLFFTRSARIFFVSPPTTHHPPPGISISDMHRLLLHVDGGAPQGLWSVR